MTSIVRTMISILLVFVTGCDNCESEQMPSDVVDDDDGRLVIGRVTSSLSSYNHKGESFDLDLSLNDALLEELSKAKAISLSAKAMTEQDAPIGQTPRRAQLKLSVKLSVDGFTNKLHGQVKGHIARTGSIPLETEVDLVRDEPIGDEGLETSEYEKHMKRALREAVESLDEQAHLLSSGNTSLIKALGHKRSNVKIAAVRSLGKRKAVEAVDPLCAALANEPEKVALAIIGSLAIIGEDRSARCIIDWAVEDERKTALIVEPLSVIGGDEAIAFLEMVVEGHRSEGIKNAAAEGLRRLGRPVKQAARPEDMGPGDGQSRPRHQHRERDGGTPQGERDGG